MRRKRLILMPDSRFQGKECFFPLLLCLHLQINNTTGLLSCKMKGSTDKTKTGADGSHSSLNFSEELFEKFFTDNYTRLYYHALHFIPDKEVCKDLVNDTFHHMWERIHTLRVDTALTYTYTHLQRLCIDYLRRMEMMKTKEQAYLKMMSEWNDDAHWMESEERIRTIMRLVERMPPLTRTIMEQCYVCKKKYKEVAEEVGLSESGVRKHIMKGLTILRNHFSVKYKKGGS